MNLSTQVYLYSIDTSAFYNEAELELHNRLNEIALEKKELRKKMRKSEKDKTIESAEIRRAIKSCSAQFRLIKNELYNIFAENNKTRILNQDFLKPSAVVAMFDGNSTRTFGLERNKLYTDIFIVRAYFFDIVKDIMSDSFYFNDDKYIFFTASAGQIRTKKTVFIKEKLWEEHKRAIMCGLDIEEINRRGGINVNKFLAYLALGHGLTGVSEGKPVFQNAVVVGTSLNPKIEDIELNGRTVRVLTAEAEIDEFTYPNFVKWLEKQIAEGSAVTGSVEIAASKSNSPIIYDGGYKEKGRVPMDYIYGGYAVISIKPADNSAVMLELNNASNSTNTNEEGNIIMNKEMIKEALADEFKSVNDKISELNQCEKIAAELNASNEAAAAKDGEITALKVEVETLKGEINAKNGEIETLKGEIAGAAAKTAEIEKKQLISELNEAIKGFTDEQKERVKDKIAAFKEKPVQTEINSIVSDIKCAIADKALADAKVVAEQNSAKEQYSNTMESIYGSMDDGVKPAEPSGGGLY